MCDSGSLATIAGELAELSPRENETLKGLLEGLGEKQIATKLALSTNTVHTYVKGLYKHFHVNSRSELLALFIPSLQVEGVQPRRASDVPIASLPTLRALRVRLARELERVDQQIAERQDSTGGTSPLAQFTVIAGPVSAT